jgi:NAD(P)-dependent dehydrogenase (short-subunit alcohol dehydrogenase family)
LNAVGVCAYDAAMLKDKVAIISGVGKGLGRELALAFSREGAKVALGARTKSYIDEVAAEVRERGGQAIAVATDITDKAQCQGLVDATVEAFGRIDALVNSAAAAGTFDLFEETDLTTWRMPFEVNVLGSMTLTQVVLPHMKAAGGGAIVNVNSMIHKKPLPRQGAYAVSKAALEAATKVLAKELGAYKIRVNSVFIGWMWGPPVQGYVQMLAQQRGVPEAEVIAGITKEIPLGIIPEDADCANTIAFLCSDLSRVVTGAGLDVNGGEFMP